MSNGLSQAEIDALLRGESAPGGETAADVQEDPNAIMTPEQIEALLSQGEAGAAAAENGQPDDAVLEELMTSVEKDAMGEIGNISMGTGATTLFALLNRRVDITTPRVTITTMEKIARQYPLPFVGVEVQYTLGLEGKNILFLREGDVKIMTDLMMGGDGTNTDGEFNDLHLSAICEVMNQMVGSSSTSLAKLLGTSIDISPPKAYRVDLGNELDYPFNSMGDAVVRTGFDLVIEGLINSEIMQVTPVPFAKNMVKSLMGNMLGMDATAAQPPAEPSPAPAPQPVSAPPSAAAPPAGGQPPLSYEAAPGAPAAGQPQAYPGYPGYPPPPPGYGYPPAYGAGYPAPQPKQMVDVHAMQYQNFDEVPQIVPGENMDLLMDVPLQVSVELGKTKKYIKEILDFNIGTIIVLDKMAGEMVDIVVNGKLIARGEVVVIDENYGARITDIISPSKRINPGKP